MSPPRSPLQIISSFCSEYVSCRKYIFEVRLRFLFFFLLFPQAAMDIARGTTWTTLEGLFLATQHYI